MAESFDSFWRNNYGSYGGNVQQAMRDWYSGHVANSRDSNAPPELVVYGDSSNPISQWWNKGANSTAQAIYDRQYNAWLQQQNWAREDRANMITMMREDTAHQRQVQDMRAAGLNPAAQNNNGAPATQLMAQQAAGYSPHSSQGEGFDPIQSVARIASTIQMMSSAAKAFKEIGKVSAETAAIQGAEERAVDLHELTKLGKSEDLHGKRLDNYRSMIENTMLDFEQRHQLEDYELDKIYKKIRNDLAKVNYDASKLQYDHDSREYNLMKTLGLYDNMTDRERDIYMRNLGNAYDVYKTKIANGTIERNIDGSPVSFREHEDRKGLTSMFNPFQVQSQYRDWRYKDSATDFLQGAAARGLQMMNWFMFRGMPLPDLNKKRINPYSMRGPFR